VPAVKIDETDLLSFSIVGFLLDRDHAEATELSLDEIWRPIPNRRWERREYTYDLIDRPRNRRRAFHLHDRERGQFRFGTAVHEHCEGDPRRADVPSLPWAGVTERIHGAGSVDSGVGRARPASLLPT